MLERRQRYQYLYVLQNPLLNVDPSGLQDVGWTQAFEGVKLGPTARELDIKAIAAKLRANCDEYLKDCPDEAGTKKNACYKEADSIAQDYYDTVIAIRNRASGLFQSEVQGGWMCFQWRTFIWENVASKDYEYFKGLKAGYVSVKGLDHNWVTISAGKPSLEGPTTTILDPWASAGDPVMGAYTPVEHRRIGGL